MDEYISQVEHKTGVVAHACHPALRRLRQDDCLGCRVTLVSKVYKEDNKNSMRTKFKIATDCGLLHSHQREDEVMFKVTWDGVCCTISHEYMLDICVNLNLKHVMVSMGVLRSESLGVMPSAS